MSRTLIFTPDPEEFQRPIMRRTAPAPRPTTDILAELSRSAPAATAAPAEPRTSHPDLSAEEREERLSAVLLEILDDPASGFRTDSVLYQEFLVRLRMRRLPGPPMSLPEFRRHVAISRSGVDAATAATEAWATALSLSTGVTDDLQGVFLMLAKAAVCGEPCPSDARIAACLRHAFGSPGQASARLFRGAGYASSCTLISRANALWLSRISELPDCAGRCQCA